MSDMNYFCVLGRITKDAKITVTQKGNKKVFFSIATNKFYRDKEGKPYSAVTFLPITVWGEYAENIYPCLTKGTCLSIEGSLRNDTWKDEQGKIQSRLVLNVSKGGLNIIGAVKRNINQTQKNDKPLSQEELENLAATANAEYQSAPEEYDGTDFSPCEYEEIQ